jgi:hypothetical protein
MRLCKVMVYKAQACRPLARMHLGRAAWGLAAWAGPGSCLQGAVALVGSPPRQAHMGECTGRAGQGSRALVGPWEGRVAPSHLLPNPPFIDIGGGSLGGEREGHVQPANYLSPEVRGAWGGKNFVVGRKISMRKRN